VAVGEDVLLHTLFEFKAGKGKMVDDQEKDRGHEG